MKYLLKHKESNETWSIVLKSGSEKEAIEEAKHICKFNNFEEPKVIEIVYREKEIIDLSKKDNNSNMKLNKAIKTLIDYKGNKKEMMKETLVEAIDIALQKLLDIKNNSLTNEEIQELENFIKLGISESSSDDITNYSYLGNKTINLLNKLNY